jgi:competence protein ComEC
MYLFNMATRGALFLKKAPFIKLLLGLITGILLQWHLQLSFPFLWILFIISLLILLSFFSIPIFKRFRYIFISGLISTVLFASFGAILTWNKDTRNDKNWVGNFYAEKDAIVATLDEPLVEKTKSFKANARLQSIIKEGKTIPVNGKIIVYFRKDSTPPRLLYGSQIAFNKPLQEIKNSGNPGGFDYKRYSLFHGITHQVFLKQDEFEVLNGNKEIAFKKFIFGVRENILNILRKNIPGEKELGLAEALLIGYKDDLDQKLVQSYTNTGVVHIIAISGLHLGLIYWLLTTILKPLRRNRKIKWLSPIIIITGLWLFSLLAGAQPSILRSALMFSCIVLGESFKKKTSVFNTMAVSAFILLCINPFWLWDVGFQLSYAAVLSIIIFMRPIYNWFYIKNKALDFIWKPNAVTLAAQILTIPLSVFHFHQFPNFFLLTNFVAVPLSGIILLGEIFLCLIAWIPAAALLAGKLLSGLIWLMNTWIERIEALPFSLWDGLQINIFQTILLIAFAAGFSYWLMEKMKSGLKIGLIVFLGFVTIRSISFIKAGQQQKVIVYNVPQRSALDFIDGRNYLFIGDPDLLADDFLRNFHLKPSRILFRITPSDSLHNFWHLDHYIRYRDKNILLLDSSIRYDAIENKPPIDLLVISKNPRLFIPKLASALKISKVVFDGSNPQWKTKLWKKDCDSLNIPWHDVTMQGAFVMKLD